MEKRGQLTELKAIRAYILGGTPKHNVFCTLESLESGNHFTYRIGKSKVDTKDGDTMHFVHVLTGPDTYTFLGTIFGGKRYFHGKRSSIKPDAPSAVAFAWLFQQLPEPGTPDEGNLPSNAAFYHSGKCARCGRQLTTPESVATGFGPVCAGR